MTIRKIKSTLLEKNVLQVDANTFADLTSIKNNVMLFDMSFGISIDADPVNVLKYDRVVVTVTDKNAAVKSSTITPASSYSSIARDEIVAAKVNPVLASTSAPLLISQPVVAAAATSVKSSALSVAPTTFSLKASTLSVAAKPTTTAPTVTPISTTRLVYSDAITQKVSAGPKMIESLTAQEVYVAKKEKNFSAELKDCINKTYATTVLTAPKEKRDPSSVANAERTTLFDTTDLLNRLNEYKVDLTAPTGIPSVPARTRSAQTINRSHHSSGQLPSTQTVDDPLARASANFYLSLGLYYLHDVKKGSVEDSQIWYVPTETTTPIKVFKSSVELPIPVINKSSTLDVKFELFKSGQTIPIETQTVALNVSRYFDVYTSIKYPPRVSAQPIDSRGLITIFIDDINVDPTSVSKFNIYVKDISATGEVSPYKRIGEVANTRQSNFTFSTTSRLSLLRVIPVDSFGRESNIFTNVVIGPGHEVVGKLAICPKYSADLTKVSVDIFNVPKDGTSIYLYRRNCTKSPHSKFELATSVRLTTGVDTHTIDDMLGVVPGNIFEYYATAEVPGQQRSKAFTSNYCFFKHPSSTPDKKSLTVKIQNYVFAEDAEGEINVSFDLVTTFTREEKAIITESLKSQLGELYEQFLNPANNPSSPLGEDKYSDLVVHEVVRTNLRTSEREVFELVGDGKFADNRSTRTVSNIKPINPLHDYYYQVFTYKRSPITLFKNYVAFGTDDRGRDWFYLPYKWNQPAVLSSGRLYADDSNGVPIVDTYDSFTSDACGLTASQMVNASTEITRIDSVTAERVDRHTIQVSWNYTSTLSRSKIDLYDSFVVLKVVNGIRSYVGRTAKSHIYHYLTPDDVGSIYYIIVPIMSDVEFDDPGFSNDIYVDPDGIVAKTVVASNKTLADAQILKFTKGLVI
jgi:hypothetical protein